VLLDVGVEKVLRVSRNATLFEFVKGLEGDLAFRVSVPEIEERDKRWLQLGGGRLDEAAPVNEEVEDVAVEGEDFLAKYTVVVGNRTLRVLDRGPQRRVSNGAVERDARLSDRPNPLKLGEGRRVEVIKLAAVALVGSVQRSVSAGGPNSILAEGDGRRGNEKPPDSSDPLEHSPRFLAVQRRGSYPQCGDGGYEGSTAFDRIADRVC
jgi:hypothetical protein